MWIRSVVVGALLSVVASGCSDASPAASADSDAGLSPGSRVDAAVTSSSPGLVSTDSGGTCPTNRVVPGCGCDQIGKTAACGDGGVSVCGQSGEFSTWGPCSCTPTTCAALGANCGSVSDGCGGTLECGTCSAPAHPHGSGRITCGGGGTPNVCGCSPRSCKEADADCGTISDGCGGKLVCGSCHEPKTCGGGGVANACGCKPTTCAEAGVNCGSVPDGCGGTLDCGSCKTPETCGGGGTPNVCGCKSTVTCAGAGANCGSISDDCGGTLDCGSCSAPESCGGGGDPQPVRGVQHDLLSRRCRLVQWRLWRLLLWRWLRPAGDRDLRARR